MKKLFSLVSVILCVVMLSTTAFAATATDPISVYTNYLKNSANITSLNMSISQKMSMTDGTESVDVLKQDIAVKMLMPSEDKLEMEMRIADPDTGEVSTAYFRNNYLYQQVGDQKVKLKMDMEQALASTANVDLDLSEDILKDAKIEVLDEGIKITYKTDLNDLEDGQGNPMASMLDSIDLPDLNVSFSKMTTSVIIGYDGMLKSGSNVIGMNISDNEVSLEFKIVQTFRVNSVNSIDFIKFPADLSSYQLLEA